ncbi:mechanosensitive ion channel family protein [Spirosoma oryzicola]|uniref:mechanosensitive ion channel family protein n=1 Tax=Spirosoma oryzicola TaxID=2898794 RepID=UPI001E56EF97|nr:mechanosensitive ion channel domain-containing protein [Spirosoma oryzicola]UHG94250.1 mechanosensitive ion channel [Spirosoma oryzicola]
MISLFVMLNQLTPSCCRGAVVKRCFLSFLLSVFVLLAAVPVVAQDSIRDNVPTQTIPDTLLFKIQKAQSVITEIKAANKRGYGVARVRAGLADVKTNIAPVTADINAQNKAIDAKTLSNYSLLLNDALDKLSNWRTTLSKTNNDLQSRLDRVVALSNDSLLTVAGNDTTDRKLYADQLSGLRVQLQEAGTRTSAQLDTVSRLLADVSGTYLNISALQTNINERVQKSNENAFQRESPYIWDAPASLSASSVQEVLTSSYQGQNKILKYFFASSWDNRFLLILLSIGFFVWVFTNFKKANNPALSEKLGELQYENIRPIPIVASLIVLLNLTPLFEPNSPSLYIELTQFLLLVALTVHLWKRFSKEDLRMWLLNVALYVLLVITNTLVGDSLIMRLWLIVLNVGFIYIGVAFFKRLQRRHISDRIIRPVIRLYLVLQLLAIVLNVFGRISLAQTFAITAVVGLVQITGLGVFIEIVLEALDLQIKISTSSAGIFSRVNVEHTRRSFKKGLAFVAVALWLLVFFINLGIADGIFNFIYQILIRPRSFGSISFTLSNLLSFSVIVYLASLLQKNIGLLFGESQLPAANGEIDQVSSVLALIRLVIIVAGVFLAVAASGISIDKLTVVLGALSVGIGLGMQNIVSNFVSGIILVFEKPFRIGDYVELADKKGRIRDIGIRSSKMITSQGSEVIIPNGDLLSNRLVNWTSSDTYLKTEFTLKVSADTDLQAIKEIIRKETSEIDGAIKTMPPDVVVTAIGPDNVELKVVVWISSIYSEASVKSQLLQNLLSDFKEANIKLV